MTPDKKDIEENKAMAAISYFSILCLFPLLFKTKSPYVQFHAKQGFVLFVAEIVLALINVMPIFGPLIYAIGMVAAIIISIIGIIKTMQGEMWEIPYISKWVGKVKFW